MSSRPRTIRSALIHGLLVVAAYTALFTLVFARPIVTHGYLADSDLYEYYLPIFLAPITRWSTFEFSGLPAFADPGDFTLYPTHFLFARVIGSWTGFIISAFVLAAVFTYAYVYRMTGSRAAAAFAGLAYPLSETMIERIPHLGILNCFAWLPLILLAIEGVRGEHRLRWIVIGAIGVACAFLAGHPQPAVYTVYFTALYALVGGLAERLDGRYWASVVAMFVLSGALASVKAIPLVEASAVMTRQEVNLGQFIGHGNTPPELLSTLFPTILHDGREAPTYVGLTTIAFALIGLTRFRRNWRIAFWLCVAVFAVLMGAAGATPIPRIVFAVVPLYQKFRVGARHLFLASFAAAFISGCGIAALQRGEVTRRAVRLAIGVFVALVAAGATAQALFPGAFTYEVRRTPAVTMPIWPTSIWIQLALAVLSIGAVALVATRRMRGAAITAALIILFADAMNAVPYEWLGGLNFTMIPAAASGPSVHAQRIGGALAPTHQRALALAGTQTDAVLPAAWARLWRIPIAGGYGPMLLDRYSRMASMGTNGSVRPEVLSTFDRSLDLAAVKFLMVKTEDVPPVETFTSDGFDWNRPDLGLPVGRTDCSIPYVRKTSIPLPPDVDVVAIGMVTHMVCAEDIPQDTTVARVRIVGDDGGSEVHELRAGVETSETGLFSEDIKGRVRHHAPAAVFDDPEARGVRAFARLALARPAHGGAMEIEMPLPQGWLSIDRLSFMDREGTSHPAVQPTLWLADPARWRVTDRFSTSRVSDRVNDEAARDESNYTIYENRRAQPLAWVASDVRGMDDATAIESVHRGQLPDGTLFDPTRTALLDGADGPPPGPFTAGASDVHVDTVDDGRIAMRVSSGGGYLVLSENFYKGWRAYIDGGEAAIRRTNLSMQGVALPPGQHRVVFELVSNTQRAGAGMSILGLLVCAVLLIKDVR